MRPIAASLDAKTRAAKPNSSHRATGVEIDGPEGVPVQLNRGLPGLLGSRMQGPHGYGR